MTEQQFDQFLSSSPVGKRVEIAPHFDRWIAGDRYARVISAEGSSGVALLFKIKFDKSGIEQVFADTNFRVL
jgi:hypothetical protein